MKTIAVFDIRGEEDQIPLQARHYIRFADGPGCWIDVELRDGEVVVRGSDSITIAPRSANQIVVKLR